MTFNHEISIPEKELALAMPTSIFIIKSTFKTTKPGQHLIRNCLFNYIRLKGEKKE
jgi:hypothetical protein